MTSESEEWRELVTSAAALVETPFLLFSLPELRKRALLLPATVGQLELEWAYSLKTAPLMDFAREWLTLGRCVEVVSAREYAQACGLATPDRIIVNGPRKADWMRDVHPESLLIFDSLQEVRCAIFANIENMRVGIRVAVGAMRDPDEPEYQGQFGMTWSEVRTALELLRDRVIPDVIHFHLRSNVPDSAAFRDAIEEVGEQCARLGWRPSVMDIGGGLPSMEEVPRDGAPSTLTAEQLLPVVSDAMRRTLPSASRLIVEFGRWLVAPCADLVVTVRDVKKRMESAYLICDGGRVNNAIVSEWQRHDIAILPARSGSAVETTVCGPTCMAWDRLDRAALPGDIQVGDRVVWRHCGAYHLGFETAFSHAPASVVIWTGSEFRVVRDSRVISERFGWA